MGARRAGRHDSGVRSSRSGRNRDLAGGEIDEEHGDQKRAHAMGAFRAQDLDLVGERDDPADAGAHQDAHVLGVGLVDDQAGVGEGLAAGNQGKLAEAVESLRLPS